MNFKRSGYKIYILSYVTGFSKYVPITSISVLYSVSVKQSC